MHCAVLGAGSWGTSLAVLLARNGTRVSLWGRDSQLINEIHSTRKNEKYLPGIELPKEISPCLEISEPVDFWIIAVPSDGLREAFLLLPSESCQVIIATKGLESATSLRASEVLEEVRPDLVPAVLSGPNLAFEIVKGVPTATVIASKHNNLAESARELFMCRTFRVYTSYDVVGVELGGALKNVLAVGAGVCEGLGFGQNTKGAMLARGLKEIASLGVACGAELRTFMGISGVGDIFATASSNLSRNYRLGKLLAEGKTLDTALLELGQVAEGAPTSKAVIELSKRLNIETPLMEAIHKVIYGAVKPMDAVINLMERMPKEEL